MSAYALDYDLEKVLPFVRDRLVGLDRSEGMRAIGLRRRGELIAGTVFDGFNGVNLWMHVAGEPGSRWMTRDFLRASFAYPFLVCGVKRVSGYVNASNAAARRLDEHLGFQLETTLRAAAPDGGDVLIYVMWKDACRFIRGRSKTDDDSK